MNKVGIEKAVPKKIVEVMKVQGLSRENVASHLQKYRLNLRRLIGMIPESCPVASFQAAKDSTSGGTILKQSSGKSLKGQSAEFHPSHCNMLTAAQRALFDLLTCDNQLYVTDIRKYLRSKKALVQDHFLQE